MKKEENYMAEEVKKEEPQKVETPKVETTSTNAVLKAADEKKEKKSKATFVRLLVMIVVFLVLGGVGIASGVFALSDLSDVVFDFSAIWKVLIMMASVITLETLIVFFAWSPEAEKPQGAFRDFRDLQPDEIHCSYCYFMLGSFHSWRQRIHHRCQRRDRSPDRWL